MGHPASPFRLLVVNHTTLYGGAEQNLRDLLSNISREELQVVAIVAPGRGPARAVWEGIGLRCIDLPVPHFTRVPIPYFGGMRLALRSAGELAKTIYFRRKFRALIRQVAPDLVYAASLHAAIAVQPVLTQTGIPLVWHLPDLVKNRLLNRMAVRSVLKNSQAIMAPSRATADSIIRLGADPARVHQVYTAVVMKNFDLDPISAVRFREEEGIGEDSPLVGMFGQVTHWKGWHILVEALPRIIARFPAARFVFVGRTMTRRDRPYQAALRVRLTKLGVDTVVRWTGFRDDVPRIMVACDLIVHASIQPEPLGVVIMEGMAARKPVICTAGGGTEEIVAHNETGIVVPPGDPLALGDAVIKLLGAQALRAEFGEKGRKVVEARFTNDRRVESYMKVFHEVAGEWRR